MDWILTTNVILIIVLLALATWLLICTPSKGDLSNLDYALAGVLQGLGQRLDSLDELIEMLPGLVPNVNLTNQNPLISLIEAFQAIKGNSGGSNTPPLMRGDNGQWMDNAEREEEANETESETESFVD